MHKRGVAVILSGGLDSTVLAHMAAGQDRPLVLVSIDYGQRHRRELEFARATATRLGVPHRCVGLAPLAALLSGASPTALVGDVPVPEGHYAEKSMRQTVVPNRNMILLAVAAGIAIADGCDAVAYGAHAGDHAIYPDCRPEFAEAMARALRLAHYEPIMLERPFVEMSKADIVRLGASLGVPFEQTWSCYVGGEVHCGNCGTCTERREAFRLAGVADPTVYATSALPLDDLLARAPKG